MLCGWLTEIDDTDDDCGDCDDDIVGRTDVVVLIDDDIGITDVWVELICHNGDSVSWNKFEEKYIYGFVSNLYYHYLKLEWTLCTHQT